MDEQMERNANMDDYFVNSAYRKEDKRYLPRWKSRNRVKFVLPHGGDVEECETIDLSCSGVGLKVPRSLVPGQSLKMKIFLDRQNTIDVQGKVMWNRIVQDGRYVGVMFDRASLDAHEMILNYAFELNPDDVKKHWFSGWNNSSAPA